MNHFIAIKSKSPPLQYIDLLPLARKYIKSDSYALSDLCLRYDYRFDMHHALNDAKAAQMLFEVMDQEFSISKTKPKTYTFKHKTRKTIDPKLANRINELAGIIDGILYDGVVTDEEIEYLKKWMKDCSRFKCYETFDNIIQNLELLLNQEQHEKQFLEELYHVVETIEGSSLYTDYTLAMQYLLGILKGITSDNVLADSEIIRLKQWVDENDWLEDEPYYARLEDALYGMDLNEVTDDDRQELMEVIQAILTPVTKKATPKKRRKSVAIDWTDKTFCMTGNFETMTRKDFGKQLTSLGAICKDSVTKTLDYLIVGGLGSDAWKYGDCGGSKISRALDIQFEGGKIKIISEEEALRGIALGDTTSEKHQEKMKPVQPKVKSVPKQVSSMPTAADWTDKTFCMTGKFETMTRKDFGKQLTNLGAIYKDSVTKTLNYLIVGGLGSDAWKYGNSGGAKISQAKKIQDSGGCIQILSEEDVLKGLEML